MSEQTPQFSISHDYEVLRPEKERAYPIPISDWDYLKKKVEHIKLSEPIFHTVGSVLLGVAGTALLAALTLPKAMTQVGSYNTHLVCWAIFLATLISGVLSLYFGHQQRKVVTNSKDDVLDEMKRLERKYEQ